MKIIFLADDDEEDRGLFEEAVSQVKPTAKVYHSTDGVHLFDVIDAVTPPLPDVIFLDINMPKMNGFDTLDEIKRNHFLKDIPVVVLSTSATTSDINKMYDHGAHFFITKPMSFKAYKSVLDTLINNKSIFNERSKDKFYVTPEA